MVNTRCFAAKAYSVLDAEGGEVKPSGDANPLSGLRNMPRDEIPQELGRAHDATVRGDAGVFGVPLGEDFYEVLAQQAVVEFHGAFHRGIERRFNHQRVIVAHRNEIFAVRLRDWQEDAFFFDFPVGHPEGAEQFGSTDFKPSQIVGVISIAHTVRIAVANPTGRPVRDHLFFLCPQKGVRC